MNKNTKNTKARKKYNKELSFDLKAIEDKILENAKGNPLRISVGLSITKLREISGIPTFDEMAEKTGISKSVIQSYAVGRSAPTSENLVAIAKAYNVSSDWILGLDEGITLNDEDVHKKTGLSQKSINILSENFNRLKELEATSEQNKNSDNDIEEMSDEILNSIEIAQMDEFFSALNILIETEKGKILSDLGQYLHGTANARKPPKPSSSKDKLGKRKPNTGVVESNEYYLFSLISKIQKMRETLILEAPDFDEIES